MTRPKSKFKRGLEPNLKVEAVLKNGFIGYIFGHAMYSIRVNGKERAWLSLTASTVKPKGRASLSITILENGGD